MSETSEPKRYLVTAEEIAAMDGLEKTHFLNENAVRTNKSLGDLTGLATIGVHLVEIAPGRETSEPHVHWDEDEAVYVLSGRGTAILGEERRAIKAGDFIGYRKGGVAHALLNDGAETLRCLVVGARLPHDVADYPRRRKRLYRNAGRPADLVDLDDVQNPKVGAKR